MKAYTRLLALQRMRVCYMGAEVCSSIPRSDRTFEHIRVLAQRYPDTKFVSIVGDKCVPNLPETRIPMIIIYRNGEVINQIVAWGADRERRIEGQYKPCPGTVLTDCPTGRAGDCPLARRRYYSARDTEARTARQ